MKTSLVALSAVAILTAACTTDPYTGEKQLSKTAIGATAGAAIGTLGGLVVGKTTSASTRKSMLIGAGVGALAGGGVGLYMDTQEKKLRKRLEATGVSVTRDGDSIILNMPSNITFDTDQSDIKPNFYQVLSSVGLVLKEYNKTIIDVTGHTDSDGSDGYNQQLSERRAASVANYLVAQNLKAERFQVLGLGESRPVASNNTEDGKSMNRRVEIKIEPLTES
jgi:outer membrane protein OmpA-like peptidoglycan-associated protein